VKLLSLRKEIELLKNGSGSNENNENSNDEIDDLKFCPASINR